MTKLALALGTRDRVELSERAIRSLLHSDIDLWVCDGSITTHGQQFAELQVEHAHVRANVTGGADAWIAYALSTLLNETDAPYVGIVENDVLLHRDWLAPTLQLFERGRAEGLEVGAVSARCYQDRILCQRDGYALMHNLGAGHIILTRHAARLILDHARVSWATENRRVFSQLSGIDIGKYWAFRGNQQFVCMDWGFDRVLAAHGLASLALVPSPVEMIGQAPSLAEQGLVLADEPVELLRSSMAFERFAEMTARVRHGDLVLNGQRLLRQDDATQIVFPHQIGALGGVRSGNWRLKWSQGFGPFAFVAREGVGMSFDDSTSTVSKPGSGELHIPVAGPCGVYVSGGETGGVVEVEDTHSGYKVAPELAPEGPHGAVLCLTVPGTVSYRTIRIVARQPGVVFYGLQVHEPQPVVPHWSFEHSQLPPPG